MQFILQKNVKAAEGIKQDHLWTMGPDTHADEIDEVEIVVDEHGTTEVALVPDEGFSDEALANLGTEVAVYQGKPQKDGGPPKQFNLVDHVEPEPPTPRKLKRKK